MDGLALIASAALLAPYVAARSAEFEEWRSTVPFVACGLLLYYATDKFFPHAKRAMSAAGVQSVDPHKATATIL